jgi:hypothetical protein
MYHRVLPLKQINKKTRTKEVRKTMIIKIKVWELLIINMTREKLIYLDLQIYFQRKI